MTKKYFQIYSTLLLLTSMAQIMAMDHEIQQEQLMWHKLASVVHFHSIINFDSTKLKKTPAKKEEAPADITKESRDWLNANLLVQVIKKENEESVNEGATADSEWQEEEADFQAAVRSHGGVLPLRNY